MNTLVINQSYNSNFNQISKDNFDSNNTNIDDNSNKNNEVYHYLSNQLNKQLEQFNQDYSNRSKLQQNVVQSVGSYINYVNNSNNSSISQPLSALSAAVLMLMVMSNYTNSSSNWIKFTANIDGVIQKQADLVNALVSFLQGISSAISNFKAAKQNDHKDWTFDYQKLIGDTDSGDSTYVNAVKISKLIPDDNSPLKIFIKSNFTLDNDILKPDDLKNLVSDVSKLLLSVLGDQYNKFDIDSQKQNAVGESEQINNLIQYIQENILKNGENARITADQDQNKDFNQSLQQMAQRVQNFLQAFARNQ